MPPAPTSTAPDRPLAAYRSPGSLVLFLCTAAALLASDLGLKHWAMLHVSTARAIHNIVPHILAIAWTENHGAVFGMWQGEQWVFVLASIVAVAVIGAFFCISRSREWVLHLALALILAGALGNLYDRIQFGYVRDMLYLLPGVQLPMGWAWPNTGSRDVYPWIFNLADAYLLTGILLILSRSLSTTEPDADPIDPAKH